MKKNPFIPHLDHDKLKRIKRRNKLRDKWRERKHINDDTVFWYNMRYMRNGLCPKCEGRVYQFDETVGEHEDWGYCWYVCGDCGFTDREVWDDWDEEDCF